MGFDKEVNTHTHTLSQDAFILSQPLPSFAVQSHKPVCVCECSNDETEGGESYYMEVVHELKAVSPFHLQLTN